MLPVDLPTEGQQARLHGAGQGALPTIAVADLNLMIVPFSAQSPARPQTSWIRTQAIYEVHFGEEGSMDVQLHTFSDFATIARRNCMKCGEI